MDVFRFNKDDQDFVDAGFDKNKRGNRIVVLQRIRVRMLYLAFFNLIAYFVLSLSFNRNNSSDISIFLFIAATFIIVSTSFDWQVKFLKWLDKRDNLELIERLPKQ